MAILDAGHQLPFAIKSVNIDLPELQGEMEDIAKEKCRIASSKAAPCLPTNKTPPYCFVVENMTLA